MLSLWLIKIDLGKTSGGQNDYASFNTNNKLAFDFANSNVTLRRKIFTKEMTSRIK